MQLDREFLEMDVNGFTVLEGVIPPGKCEQIRATILDVVERETDRNPSPDRVGFVPGVINHDQSFAGYVADQKLLLLIGGLLGHNVRISFTSAIVNYRGNARGKWHADWPFNQNNAGHIPAPYPDAVMHLTTLWMLSPFSIENGGTLVVPGSHRAGTNPTAPSAGVDPEQPFPTEMQITGAAGSVLVMDSRLWHATAPNRTAEPRVALAVRYAPWWLNTEILRPGSVERRRLVDEPGRTENQVPAVPRHVFEKLADRVQSLYRHWVDVG